jgi:dephospho-CoA kinase
MLIAVTGYKNSGKNAVCNVLEEVYGFKITGMADALKEQMLAIDPIVHAIIRTEFDGGGPDYFDGNPSVEVIRLSQVVAEDGWDEAKEKYPEVRRLLQYAGTEGGRKIFGENIWAETWYKRTKVLLEQEYDVCVSDMRFLNEAKYVRDLGGVVWRVHRPGTAAGEHASESELDSIVADHSIRNGGSLADLHGLVVGQMLP